MDLTIIELQTIVMSLDMLIKTTEHHNKKSARLHDYCIFVLDIMDEIEKEISKLQFVNK